MTRNEFNELDEGDIVATFADWTSDSAKLSYAKVSSRRTKGQRAVAIKFLAGLKKSVIGKRQCRNWKVVRKESN